MGRFDRRSEEEFIYPWLFIWKCFAGLSDEILPIEGKEILGETDLLSLWTTEIIFAFLGPKLLLDF